MSSTAMTVGRRQVAVSNSDKVLYPSGFTKGEVVDYYLKVAPVMLPYLKDRAVTLKRYPNGSNKPFFFEKNCPAHKPDWVKTATIASRTSEGKVDHCLLNDAASLVWAANLAALELHVPLGKSGNPDRPTMMVFDLDPGPGITVLDCAEMALKMRDLFKKLGMICCPKTSGSKGLHVYVPLNTPVDFDQTKSFARAVAELFQKNDPKRATAVMSKDLRGGRVFIDWSQNDRHKTTACAYTLRATDTPNVSTPMEWKEVEAAIKKKNPAALTFQADDVLQRVKARGDVFLPVLKEKQRLPRFPD